MGYFIGVENRQGYVHDDGTVWTNPDMTVKMADTEGDFLGGVSLIVPKLPDENGEITYGEDHSDENLKCEDCDFTTHSNAGLIRHHRKAGHGFYRRK